MDIINMPGFTADSSLYKTARQYHSTADRAHGNGEPRVIPQIPVGGLDGLNAWLCCKDAHLCGVKRDKICCDEWEPCTVIGPGVAGIFAGSLIESPGVTPPLPAFRDLATI